MLQLNDLGLEVIRPVMALNGNLGLGAYTEGVCAEGKDFVCGVRNGIHSCRPCKYDQLDAFRALQGEINRIIVIKGLSGLLDIDGRMGPRTARALAAVANATSNAMPQTSDVMTVVQACNAAPDSPATHRLLARFVPELRAYFAQVADLLGASHDYPEAPMPDADKAGAGNTIPVPIVEPDGGIVTERQPVSQAGVGGWGPFLALVGICAGGGLAVWGYKRYGGRHRR